MQFKSYLEQLRESNPEAYNQIYTELYDKVYSNVVDDLTHEMVQLDSSYIEDDFSDLDTTTYDGLENEPTFDVDVTDDYIFEDMYHSDEKVPSIVAEVFVVCVAKLIASEANELLMVKLPVRLAPPICSLVTPVIV